MELQLSISLSLLWIYGFNSTQLRIFFFTHQTIKPTNQIQPNYTYKKFKLKMNQTFLEDKTYKPCQTLAKSLSRWAEVSITVGGGGD